MEKNIEELKRIIEESDNIVFFGGAGVSTESDIPDFRSVDGLYNQKYDYPPEMIISHSFFNNNRGEFFRFYKEKMLFPGAIPNKAHIKLAELEKKGILCKKVYPILPLKVEYSLTEFGEKLIPIINDLSKWGDYYKDSFLHESL